MKPLTSHGLRQRRQRQARAQKIPVKSSRYSFVGLSLGVVLVSWLLYSNPFPWPWQVDASKIAPLAMRGGDPYVRALMRTISASEANDPSPYTILYGGEHIQDLRRHPDTCVPIANGPNLGRCTTAAGRYQFLTTTWVEKAQRYHPQVGWTEPDFLPISQDRVVYAWLSDERAWGVNIPQMLRKGELEEVLRLLSGTWTSLGYGIESNLLTPSLKSVYQDMLAQERGW
jgi:muramidase (phage lysozyme)